MYFTQDDYLKIQKWLQRNSVKDTEFQEADTPLAGNEVITVVQNGYNRKVYLKDLVNQIFSLGVADFVNVSALYDEYNITLSEAIKLVPHKSRKRGQVISFNNTEGNWELWQFKGSKNQWNIIGLWESFMSYIPEGFVTLDKLSQEVKDVINSGGAGEVLDGSINESKLTKNAVSTDKIQDGAVTWDKLYYYIRERLDSIPYTTDNLVEGDKNKYFSEAKVNSIINASSIIKEYDVCPKTIPVLKSSVSAKQSVFTRPSSYPTDCIIVYHDGEGLSDIISNPAFIAYSRQAYDIAVSQSKYDSVQWWVVFENSKEYNSYDNDIYPTRVQVRPDRFFINKNDGELYRYNSVSKEFKSL